MRGWRRLAPHDDLLTDHLNGYLSAIVRMGCGGVVRCYDGAHGMAEEDNRVYIAGIVNQRGRYPLLGGRNTPRNFGDKICH